MLSIAGSRVRALRHLLCLSQVALAARSGLGRLEILRIESGRNDLSSDGARAALARGVGLTVDQLFELLDGRLSAQGALLLSSAAPRSSAAHARRRAVASAVRRRLLTTTRRSGDRSSP